MEGKLQEKSGKKKLQIAIVKQMVILSTAGFGLIAALSWNNLVQEIVESYIKPFLPQGSGILSLFIYAVIITILAVIITTNLTTLAEKLEK